MITSEVRHAGGATYRLILWSPNVVAIVDASTELSAPVRSVTNAAEAVVADLWDRGLLAEQRLVYRDTEGRWDEIVQSRGTFLRFAPLGLTDLLTAVKAVGFNLVLTR
jgi:hypothetical protein